MKIIGEKRASLKAKRTFLSKGTCSYTFFHILNREFGHPKENEERALELHAGGIVQQGYQCGMLWGASMGVAAEAYRRFPNRSLAIGMAIRATQHISKSFVECARSSECADITKMDRTKKFNLLKFLLKGNMITCLRLAGKWAPDALQSANDGLQLDHSDLSDNSMSCASELVNRLDGTEEEMVMIAGFAGGLGLSGGACGALSAAIWMSTLKRVRNNTYKSSLSDPVAEKIINTFYETTDYEMECSKICGRKFDSVADHSEFIKNGGCSKLIQVLTVAVKTNS